MLTEFPSDPAQVLDDFGFVARLCLRVGAAAICKSDKIKMRAEGFSQPKFGRPDICRQGYVGEACVGKLVQYVCENQPPHAKFATSCCRKLKNEHAHTLVVVSGGEKCHF